METDWKKLSEIISDLGILDVFVSYCAVSERKSAVQLLLGSLNWIAEEDDEFY